MSIDLLAIISVAFFSSFGHCYFMCGGFNLAFLHANSKNKNIFSLSFIYHIFRIFSYMFLGFIFFYFINFISINNIIQNILFFFFGIFMIVLGISLIFKGKFLYFLEKNILFEKIIKKMMIKIINFKGYKSAVLLGFLNGFVPCGLVYFFIINASTQKNIFYALFVMFVFGISTLPAMLFFISFCDILSNKIKNIFNCISYILIIIYGIYLSFISFLNFK